MRQRYLSIALIVILVILSVYIVIPNNPGIHIGNINRDFNLVLGLDLKGGLQVLLEVPASIEVTASTLEDARQILENRSNGLGVSEVTFQIAGTRRIVGEFPGLTNTGDVINVLKETGQLEFVDMGDNPLPEGTVITTDLGQAASNTETTGTPAAETSPTTTPEGVSNQGVLATDLPPTTTETAVPETVYHTVMTGDQLSSVTVGNDALGAYVINFALKEQGAQIFKDYTTANVGKYLGIVLDNKVISSPRIHQAITEGSGQITGSFTYDSANNLAVQLRYGSLPIPLNVLESRLIGPSLGQDSLQKSLLAGIIGFIIISLFMLIYYRLPGLVAVIAIAIYGLITLAIYKFIPVTLTLPGIAGFLLSTGGALDANILIFERLKEELRSGRKLAQAVELGWKRAWPSIRDSNAATLITSIILFWFGSVYGASSIKGFSFTLAIGVLVSLFGAIVVTRVILTELLNVIKTTNYARWFGL